MADKLKLLPLGGLGEIGMNCFVLEWQNEIVLIDCGIQFPDSSYAGVELLAPDLSYVVDRISKLRGVVITHGHDDHIGGIPFILKETDLDLYSTAFPKGLIENKLSEYNDLKEIRFHTITPREKFKIGSFIFDPIPVQHSIIESLAFAVETPVGVIVHTGDFKHDDNEACGNQISFAPFEEYGKRGVDLLLSDSTNAERPGHTISEKDIQRNFEQIFRNQSGRLIIALFASNICRIENLLKIAKEQGKKVALAGRSMLSYTKLAHDQGSLEIPPDTLILLEHVTKYPDQEIIVLATGSQAEPGSALVRVSEGFHKDLQVRATDLVILSSRFIPGNERNITKMIDRLYRAGAEVMYETAHQIHVSGHGFQDELMAMLKATQPKYFIPIHGEYRHLKKHALLAKKSGVHSDNIFVVENGQSLELAKDSMALSEKLDIQKIAIVGGDALDTQEEDFASRNALAKSGVVVASIIINKKTGKVWTRPQVASHGLLNRRGVTSSDLNEDAIDRIIDVANNLAPGKNLTDNVKLELRRLYKKKASHKPLVIVLTLFV